MSTLYPRPASERYGTKTRRRNIRRDVRAYLGVSSDEAPDLMQALNAAAELQRIIDLASNGRYGLAVVRPSFSNERTQERCKERWNFPVGVHTGTTVKYEGTEFEVSSLVHEPISETRRRERHLREVERNERRRVL